MSKKEPHVDSIDESNTPLAVDTDASFEEAIRNYLSLLERMKPLDFKEKSIFAEIVKNQIRIESQLFTLTEFINRRLKP